MSLSSEEQWRPIPGYEDTYLVSDLGRVWGRPRRSTKGGITKLRTSPAGYVVVDLSQRNQRSTHLVHRLVALAFMGPCPEGLEVRHLDGDSANPVLTNLAYGTSSQNKWDTVRHGRHHQVSKTHCPHGHPYDEKNTYRSPDRSHRACRTCHTARKTARRRARAAMTSRG